MAINVAAALTRPFGSVIGVIVNLNPRDTYFHWGFILISMANLLVVVAMVIVFALALVVPFVHSRKGSPPKPHTLTVPSHPGAKSLMAEAPEESGLWTAKVRRVGMRLLPPDKLLPDAQPAYVASWVYVFGVLTLSGLVVVVISGLILAIEGPTWWHTSSVGHFVNSLHLWSVELFMAFMAIHLWGKFWMAAWRGRRRLTWITGVVAFIVSIIEAFTGYISQTNFDSQWIAFQAKDAFNSGGIGALVNTMNFGQALMLHIALVPLILVLIVGVHVMLVRIRGVVPPIDALESDLGSPSPGPLVSLAAAPVPSAVSSGMAPEGSGPVGSEEEGR